MSVLQQYKTWVRNNHNLIGAIEGGLSSLTWLLPDRFSESELNLEALNSFLGFLGLFHESILNEPLYQKGVPQPVQWSFWLGAAQQVGDFCRQTPLAAELLSNTEHAHAG